MLELFSFAFLYYLKPSLECKGKCIHFFRALLGSQKSREDSAEISYILPAPTHE